MDGRDNEALALDAAARACDAAATLLMSTIPCAVRRAEHRLLCDSAADEEALRTLLEFHQDIVSPISEHFAYALPCGAALRAIARHAPAGVIEPGAGGGLWAGLLRRCLPAVDASDCAPALAWDDQIDVVRSTLGSDRRSEDPRALLLCWPPLELEDEVLMAVDALETYRGRTLLYVGEWRGSTGVVSALSNLTDECGQTAGAVFQEAVQRDWEPVERVALPRWPGFTDALFVFRRKGSRDAATADGTGQQAADSAREQGGHVAGATSSRPARSRARRAELAERLRGLAALGIAQPAVLAAAIVLDVHLRGGAQAAGG